MHGFKELIPCINNLKCNFIYFSYIIGKNNNVNFADVGAKFTMSHSVVNIGNVHQIMCIHALPQHRTKICKTSHQFLRKNLFL